MPESESVSGSDPDSELEELFSEELSSDSDETESVLVFDPLLVISSFSDSFLQLQKMVQVVFRNSFKSHCYQHVINHTRCIQTFRARITPGESEIKSLKSKLLKLGLQIKSGSPTASKTYTYSILTYRTR